MAIVFSSLNSFADFGLIDLGNCFSFPCELLWVNLCEIQEGLYDSSSSFDELNGVLIDYFVKDLAIIWGKELCGSKFIVRERDVIDFFIVSSLSTKKESCEIDY